MRASIVRSRGSGRELADYYPDAKVILSTRDPESWFRSVHNTIYPATVKALQADDPRQRNWAQWVNELIWERELDGNMQDHDGAIDVFRRHLETVQATITPERLLVFEASQGWDPLCEFLAVPVPDEPYPQTNSTAQFQRGAAS